MTLDRETILPLAARVCAVAEARTGGICTWRLEEEGVQCLSFRLEALGKVVGAGCSGVVLAQIVDPAILEREIVKSLLRQLELG